MNTTPQGLFAKPTVLASVAVTDTFTQLYSIECATQKQLRVYISDDPEPSFAQYCHDGDERWCKYMISKNRCSRVKLGMELPWQKGFVS